MYFFKQLRKKYPEVRSLRGVSMEKLNSVKAKLSDVVYRCACRHRRAAGWDGWT